MLMRILAAILSLTALAAVSAQQAPRELFERARMLEESNNKLGEAIVLYAQVAAQTTDRQLAATAQLRIGLIHERLGQKDQAERAFKTVIGGYSEQADVVRQARERLPAPPMSRGGFTARRVWEALVTPPQGTVSADGRYLSLTDWADGSLTVRELTTGTMRKLTRAGIAEGFAYGSVLSADGAVVAFNWFHSKTSALELRAIRLDTHKETILYRNDQLKYFQPLDWSHDGTQLLMLFSRLDGTNQIALLSVATGSARVLKTFDWRAPVGIAFSPDSRWIVYDFPAREQARERDLFVLAADGSSETRLVDHPSDDVVLGWAPDGRTVLFASDRTGARGAWTIQVKDGKAAGAAQWARAEFSSRIVPLGFTRGGAFYYFAATSVSDVYTADVDVATGRVTAPPSALPGRFLGGHESADWSPDGRSLAIVTQPPGLGDKQIRIQSPGGDRDIPLRLSPANWPRWAPDGASILISGRGPKSRGGLFRVDVRTGVVSELLPESTNGIRLRAEWAADGKSIFFARRDDECLCVIRGDLATGQQTVVHRAPPSRRQMTIAPSPDGGSVAVMMYDERRQRPMLLIVPAAGGAARVLYEAEDLAWFSLLDWTPDSTAVLFGRNGSPERGKVGVWRLDAGGGEAVSLGLAMEGLRDLTLRSDGRRVAFTAGVNKGDVWVIDNFLPASTPTTASGKR